MTFHPVYILKKIVNRMGTSGSVILKKKRRSFWLFL